MDNVYVVIFQDYDYSEVELASDDRSVCEEFCKPRNPSVYRVQEITLKTSCENESVGVTENGEKLYPYSIALRYNHFGASVEIYYHPLTYIEKYDKVLQEYIDGKLTFDRWSITYLTLARNFEDARERGKVISQSKEVLDYWKEYEKTKLH